MKYYCIDALAPLVFRSGRPFGAQSDTEDIVFPLPSAAAGLVRTVSAQQKPDFIGFDKENTNQIQELKQIQSYGLFLVQLREDDSGSLKIERIFVPKPNDAIYMKNKETDKTELLRLIPKIMPKNCGCDLPDGLLPVYLEKGDIKGKPQKGVSFWALNDFLKWQKQQTDCQLNFEMINQNGCNLPVLDTRTHVAIDAATQTSEDGKLFQTAAYDLANPTKKHHQGWENHHYGFLICTDKDLEDNVVRFGGEGRLSYLQAIELNNVFKQPEQNLIEEIKQKRGIKLTLLTPAIFKQGWLPDWLDSDTLTGTLPHTNIKVTLRAAAIDRWQPISGWNLAEKAPKLTYKAVSAGAVYWFEISDTTDLTVEQLNQIAYQSICTDEHQKDGFGIVAIAAWDATNIPTQSNH